MKSIFLTAALFAGSTIAFAQQDTTATPSEDTTAFHMQYSNELAMLTAQDEKALKAEELPEGVQKTLKADKYKGWKVESATAVQGKEGVTYKVIVTDGTKKETLTLDENGNAIA